MSRRTNGFLMLLKRRIRADCRFSRAISFVSICFKRTSASDWVRPPSSHARTFKTVAASASAFSKSSAEYCAPFPSGTGIEAMGAGPGSDLFRIVGKVKILSGTSPVYFGLPPLVAPHFQSRISGKSWLFLSMYCLCSMSLSHICCFRYSNGLLPVPLPCFCRSNECVFVVGIHNQERFLGQLVSEGFSRRGVGSHSKFLQARFDAVDNFVRRGSSRREADGLGVGEPFQAEIGGSLDVMDRRTQFGASDHQLAGVVAVHAADDHHYARIQGHLDGGRLALLRGLANCVDEAHLGDREPFAHESDQLAHLVDGLRGLCRDAEACVFRKRRDVLFGQHDIKSVQVAGQAAYFHMLTVADDDWMEAFLRQL